jgi:hypothetical protein
MLTENITNVVILLLDAGNARMKDNDPLVSSSWCSFSINFFTQQLEVSATRAHVVIS